jgi:hypothetical protein
MLGMVEGLTWLKVADLPAVKKDWFDSWLSISRSESSSVADGAASECGLGGGAMEADEAAEACPTYKEGSQRTGGEITMAKSYHGWLI